MQKIILASTSPRRIEMMRWLGVSFESVSADLDESTIRHDDPEELTRLLATAKAQCVVDKYPDSIIIGSDAVVSFNNMILEKPRDKDHQRELINMQIGRKGKTYSSVCVINTATGQKTIKSKSISYIMTTPTNEQIEKYIESGDGLDKAGGFGLQDYNGMFTSSMDGCYPTALGMPLCELVKILQNDGIEIGDVNDIVKSKTGQSC